MDFPILENFNQNILWKEFQCSKTDLKRHLKVPNLKTIYPLKNKKIYLKCFSSNKILYEKINEINWVFGKYIIHSKENSCQEGYIPLDTIDIRNFQKISISSISQNENNLSQNSDSENQNDSSQEINTTSDQTSTTEYNSLDDQKISSLIENQKKRLELLNTQFKSIQNQSIKKIPQNSTIDLTKEDYSNDNDNDNNNFGNLFGNSNTQDEQEFSKIFKNIQSKYQNQNQKDLESLKMKKLADFVISILYDGIPDEIVIDLFGLQITRIQLINFFDKKHLIWEIASIFLKILQQNYPNCRIFDLNFYPRLKSFESLKKQEIKKLIPIQKGLLNFEKLIFPIFDQETSHFSLSVVDIRNRIFFNIDSLPNHEDLRSLHNVYKLLSSIANLYSKNTFKSGGIWDWKTRVDLERENILVPTQESEDQKIDDLINDYDDYDENESFDLKIPQNDSIVFMCFFAKLVVSNALDFTNKKIIFPEKYDHLRIRSEMIKKIWKFQQNQFDNPFQRSVYGNSLFLK
ncbi:deneddylase 1 isoform c-related [Anaeramoeba ignava]|uniref:Deneddylase 1 isoform c-related n=1 Tax=Anaeramoeba ignava TaxID=1746090 RepID=A0A9Q0LKQ2_ANAIG|nr:deneddylase 1 isoform c-related [Anaeramoeba ignava]